MKTLNELAAEFMVNYAKIRLRPSTVRGYSVNLKKHILPVIGELTLDRITTDKLDELNSSMVTLSNKSKIYCHATLRKILNYAIKRKYLQNNPYESFDMPKAEKYHYTTLSENEIKRMLQLVKGKYIEAPVTMALCYGLRRGECLGIEVQDLNIDKCTLHIQRTKSWENGKEIITPCKTEESNREILIREEHLKMLMGAAGKRTAYLTTNMLESRFKEFLRDYGFQKIRFHDLRHTYATLMMKKGINPKIISQVLGHSKVNTTLDIYSHPDIEMQQICIDVFG